MCSLIHVHANCVYEFILVAGLILLSNEFSTVPKVKVKCSRYRPICGPKGG